MAKASSTEYRWVTEMRRLSATCTRPSKFSASIWAVAQEAESPADIGIYTNWSCPSNAFFHTAITSPGAGWEVAICAPETCF